MNDVMTATFQDIICEVNKLSCEDNITLDDVIRRTKIVINKTFGKQYYYLKQLDNISFTPSVYELTKHEHFKKQLFQEIAKKSPNDLKESIETDCLAHNEQLPPELQEKSPQEFKECLLQAFEEYYKSEESRMRETSWSSGIKSLLGLLKYLSMHVRLLKQDSDILRFQVKGKDLFIYRGGDKLIELTIKPKKHDPNKGELDVFIDAPSGINFNKVQIHQPNEVLSYNNVHLCSWHGFYQEKNNDLLLPLINLKDASGKKIPNGEERRHNAIVSQRDIIAVPVCAIQIPTELELRDRLNRSELAATLDLFILPKNISWEKYVETTVYKIYCLSEHIACFSPYMRGMMAGGLAENCIVDINPIEFVLEEGRWDAILRCIYLKNVASDYSVCFYATRNPIDYALNRGFSKDIQDTPYGEESLIENESIRALHETELRRLGICNIYSDDGYI